MNAALEQITSGARVGSHVFYHLREGSGKDGAYSGRSTGKVE